MTATHDTVELGPFIAGSAEPLGGDTLEIRDPATRRVVGRATAATADDVDRAVRAAHDAFPAWSSRGVSDRGEVVAHAAAAIRAAVDDLAPLPTPEQGRPRREAPTGPTKAAGTPETYAGLAKE